MTKKKPVLPFRSNVRGLIVGALMLLTGNTPVADAADKTRNASSPARPTAADSQLPEGVQKFWNTLTGQRSEQFYRSRSRYGWGWLANRYDGDGDNRVDRTEFPGSDELFRRLDRTRNGDLTSEDFDWSERSPLVRQASQSAQAMGKIDKDGNGHISPEEWQAVFAKAAKAKAGLTPQDLADLFYPVAPTAPRSPAAPGSDLAMRWERLQALLRGDTGNLLADGPLPGRSAPDFVLKNEDESRKVRLSDYRGKKPVVLVFGSFT